MRATCLCLLASASSLLAQTQPLTAAETKVVDDARARYYNLQTLGLVSFKCDVKFDTTTLPLQLLPPEALSDRKAAATVDFSVELGRFKPIVRRVYPTGSSALTQQGLSNVVSWMESILSGFFNTWPSKSFTGPIPPFDQWVDHVKTTEMGYSMQVKSSDGPETLELDKGFVVTRILSAEGKIDEHPRYLETKGGLVFSGNVATDTSSPTASVHVAYEIENELFDGFLLPGKVHLRVNDNVDVRFAMVGCKAVKGVVVKVGAP